jgi:hypothetical protein
MDGKVVFIQGEVDFIKFGFETSDALLALLGSSTFQLFTLPTPEAPDAVPATGFTDAQPMTSVSAGPAVQTRVAYWFDSTAVPPGDYQGNFVVVGTMAGRSVRICGQGIVRILAPTG